MEIWKDIKGFENRYQASNLGRIKTLIFKNNKYEIKREKILKQYLGNNGYLRIGLTNNNGKRNTYYVHRLIAETFLEKNENQLVVNHKDEDKTNNNVENLEWITKKDNILYSFNLHKERIKAMQTKEATENRIKHFRKPVMQLDKNNNIINIFDSVISASKYTGFDKSTIANCCRNYYKQAYGYNWEYIRG